MEKGEQMTKEDLLKEFPDHKLIVHHCDMDNNITDIFTYYDQIELEERLLEKRNKYKIQGELFL